MRTNPAKSAPARAVVDLKLQLGGQLLLFVIADLALLLWSVFQVLVGGATPRLVYTLSGALPLVLLGSAACSTAFAVERRAGNIELTVSLPRPWRLFFRRAGWVVGLLALQGAALMLCSWALEGFSYPIVPVLLQLAALAVLVAAAGLAWSATTTSPPVAFVGALGSLFLLAPWTFFVPVRPAYDRLPRALLPEPAQWPELLAVLGFALALAALAIAYVRRRLLNPLSLTR